jgi:hypothetical protein
MAELTDPTHIRETVRKTYAAAATAATVAQLGARDSQFSAPAPTF